MIQSRNSVTLPIIRLDSIMSELVNMSQKILSYQPLTNPYISNSIDWTQESCCFENQDSISAHQIELDQISSFESPVDILASYLFSEIELEHKCDPEPQIGNSIPLLDSIMTLVSLTDFLHYSESVLDPVLLHREIESPIFYTQHIELDLYYTFENPIDKLISSHFHEIKLNQECDPDPQFCDPVQISKLILTLVLLPSLSNILESVLISIPVILELESLKSHISLWENECGLEF